MCQLKMLSSSSDGYVAVCPDCKHCYVGFGVVQIVASENELRALAGIVRRDMVNGRDNICRLEKRYTYATDSSRVHMVLSYQEVESLQTLLDSALLRLDVRTISAIPMHKN